MGRLNDLNVGKLFIKILTALENFWKSSFNPIWYIILIFVFLNPVAVEITAYKITPPTMITAPISTITNSFIAYNLLI